MRDLVRRGFRLILEREPDIEVVGEAGHGAEALRLCRTAQPDVVLYGYPDAGDDGIAVTQQITAAGQTPRVLILTTFDLDELVYGALLAEASGFLLKDVKTGVLAPSLTRRLIGRFVATRPRNPGSSAALDELTARGREVLVAHRVGAVPRRDRGVTRGQSCGGEDPCRPGVRQGRRP